MAIPHLLGLPMELIYQVFEDFSPGEVMPFAQTSQGALVLSLSFVDLEEMFKWACEENIKQAMLLMCSAILRAAQDDPEIGYNALAQACKGRHIEIVQLLVSGGVRIEWPGSLGLTRKADFYNTPLGCAMRDSNPKLLNLLLEAGANIDSATNHYSEPSAPYIPQPSLLHHASIHGFISLIHILLARGADVNQHDRLGTTPLQLAAEWGHIKIVKLFLSRGADINQRGRFYSTPLHQAAENGHVMIVKLLLAHGADVDLADNKGRTALSVAACQEYKATVRLLLDAGAQIDTRDKAGYTPLILATMRNRDAILKLLVQSGADVNLASKLGRTALSFAVEFSLHHIVEYLAGRGADAYYASRYGLSPMCYAEKRRKTYRLVTALNEAGCRRTRCWVSRERGGYQEHLMGNHFHRN